MVFNDTIAAIATPPGEGGIGVIRISGPEALSVASQVLKSTHHQPFSIIQPRKVYHGEAIHLQTGNVLDEVIFFYFQKPHSYTGEDIIEIQAHGSMLGLTQILNQILSINVRLADPGEFTQRAFLNGRIDLIQAESVIDLIRAKTEKGRQLALRQLQGRSTAVIHSLESDLYQILTLIEALLDFPEEGIPDIEQASIIHKVTLIIQQLVKLIQNSEEGQKIQDGISIVITGRPNVGKSSLLNSFLQEERAIVTSLPGTTRDVIEAQYQLKGIPIRLIDTAGLRETDNPVEQIGIKKAQEYLDNADLILLVIDGSEPLTSEDSILINKFQDRPLLVVINKTDLPQKVFSNDFREFSNLKLIETSTLSGEGLERLESAVTNLIGMGRIQVDDLPILSRIRHKKALENAVFALQRFIQGIRDGLSEDLLAVELREALTSIGQITGKNVTSEVIEQIFSQFCIGK